MSILSLMIGLIKELTAMNTKLSTGRFIAIVCVIILALFSFISISLIEHFAGIIQALHQVGGV